MHRPASSASHVSFRDKPRGVTAEQSTITGTSGSDAATRASAAGSVVDCGSTDWITSASQPCRAAGCHRFAQRHFALVQNWDAVPPRVGDALDLRVAVGPDPPTVV